jgi:microcystin-dependent protein
MSEVFIGEIRAFGFDFTPESWISCNGQMLPIANEFMALYSILGTTYGGNGRTEFGIPNLNGTEDQNPGADIGRAPMMAGHGVDLTNHTLGEKCGSGRVTISTRQLPSHNHAINTYVTKHESDLTDTPDPGCLLSRTYQQADYSKTAQAAVEMEETMDPAGGAQPHDNNQPYVRFHYCICYDGVYPPRP